MYSVLGIRPNAPMARASVEGRLLLRSERMSSDALTVPCWSDPATRNKSSQLRVISVVFTRDRAMAVQDPVVGRGIETPEPRFANVG